MFDHVLCGTCCLLGFSICTGDKEGAGNRVHTSISVTVLSNTLTKRQEKIVRCQCRSTQCTTKLTQVSSFSQSHTSHQIRDRSESGRSREVLAPGTSDSAGRAASSPEIFWSFLGRLFDRLPVRIATSDLNHRILRKISELMILECSFPLKRKLFRPPWCKCEKEHK